MAETLTITTERLDDMPFLLAQLDRLGVQPRLDAHVPTPGNWVGLSLGWVTVRWLTHILTIQTRGETGMMNWIPFTTIAVGMPVTRHPPHRSVRAALPHTALTLDAWRQSGHLETDAGYAGWESNDGSAPSIAASSGGSSDCAGRAAAARAG